MRMNAGIILQGSSPDIVGSLDRGARAGRRQALSDLYRQHGEGIASGDQASLNRLAQLDPNAALQVQSQQQDMAAQKQRMQALDAQQQQAIMQRAAQASAAELAAEKEAIKQGLLRANVHFKNGDLQGVNAILQQAGEQPIQSLEQFPAVAGMYGGVLEVLERVNEFSQEPQDPAAIQALRIRAQEAGLQPDTPEYQEFMRNGGRQPAKGSTIYDPATGRPVAEIDGGAGTEPRKLTERQSQLTLFGSMMQKTMPIIDGLEESFDPANLKDNAAARAGWAGNYFKSQNMQIYETAGRAWAEGVLRLQTGAAATQPEIERVFATYFAQPGDSPETVAFKRAIREDFAASVGAASGGLVDPTTPDPEPTQQVEPYDPQTPDFTQMSDEELEAYIAKGGS